MLGLRTVIVFIFLLIGDILCAQDFTAFRKEKFTAGSRVLPYRILLPKDFDESKKYPFILFLHGSGERGSDNEKQLTHGAELFLRDLIRERFPAIIVFPQCSENSTWSRLGFGGSNEERTLVFYEKAKPTEDMILLEGLLDELFNSYKIKKDQRYVGGLSMGGFGTFELINRNPRMFDAAFPICGGANPKIAKRLRKMDWWVFHGGADKVVPSKYSTQMVEALKQKRANVKYSLYPAVGHNSWDYAFKEPELMVWMFSKSR